MSGQLSVVQIEYVNGRCTTDVVVCPVDEIIDGIGDTGRATVGGASKDYQWIMFPTRDWGELIVRADQVAFIRARPLGPDESMDSWSERQRAFRGVEGGGR